MLVRDLTWSDQLDQMLVELESVKGCLSAEVGKLAAELLAVPKARGDTLAKYYEELSR